MTAALLKGAPVAAALGEDTRRRAAALRARGVVPALAILRVGERPDDLSYERGALRRCGELGVEARVCALPANAAQGELMAALEALNRDAAVHGILLLRPLPRSLDEEAARAALLPEKDVDGITDGSLAGVFTGRPLGFAPCTAEAAVRLLEHCGVPLSGKRAVIIGRSLVVGRPAAMLLLARDCTVTLCHSKSENLPAIARGADILITALGRARAIGARCFAPGQIVVDVGINWDPVKNALTGDADIDAALHTVAAITPVPGGVGAVTTAVLADHVVRAAETQRP